MSCAICERRKEKRFCLAVHGRICPQCCGEQREITLDCPSECPYLQQARLHEKHESGAPEEMAFPKVRLSEQFIVDREPVILGILHTVAKARGTDRRLTDRDVIEALTIMAESYQTLIGSGLIYQERRPNPVHESLIEQLRKLLEDFRAIERQHLGHTTLSDTDVLKSVVFVLRMAAQTTSGRPLSRAFLDSVTSRFPDTETSAPGTGRPHGQIIIP